MATNFPTSLDSLTNPQSSDALNNPSHSGQHANANDAIEALQAKVGVDSSAITTSHDYKIGQLETNSISKTIVDAKGDLIVATGADTVDNLTVGTDGQYLVADSLETTGLKWFTLDVTLGTQTTGNYVATVGQGTGVTVTGGTGEGSTPTIAIGQAVGTTDTVAFGGLNVDSGTLYVDPANNRVGINDSSPSYALDVTGSVYTTGDFLIAGEPAGFKKIPLSGSEVTTSYTLQTSDVGKYIQVGTGGSITIPDATFAQGDVISIVNNTSGNITITCSITTAYLAGVNTDRASLTLATRGIATVLFVSSTVCIVTGSVS